VGETKIDRRQVLGEKPRHCMFEYAYFARPDSVLNDVSVYEARRRLGRILAKEAPVKADVVVAVPDTSRPAAASYAAELNLPCEEGLIKNRYIGRTFIMPSQEKRTGAVKLKLNPLKNVIDGKRVVLVDDSIVRGTTLKEIVALVRSVGAREVHIRIPCPPVKAPCFYGVDIPTYKELIANRKTVEEIRKYLNADSLHYISIDGLKDALKLSLCTGCLNEDYPTKYVKELAEKTKSGE
jgi:amidophosphoribosyltransferase